MSEDHHHAETPSIGVVIVAYQSTDLLEDCISGVLLSEHVSSVVIVDNSSNSLSAAIVGKFTSRDPRVKYVDPLQNLGFARGCNVGVSVLSHWTHVFFVNPDVRLVKPLLPLVDILESGPYAVVAGRLNTPSHPESMNARKIVSWRREFAKALVGSRAYTRRVGRESTAINTPFVVEQVDGALLGMRRETFEFLGGFDEQFELYYEDVDICARANLIGGCVFSPVGWGVHVGGASSSSASAMSYCLGRVSRVRYLRKRYGNSKATKTVILGLALTEFLTRTITRQGEGRAARAMALRQQLAELRTPASVRMLA